ncbi:hypothetical protein HYQ43_04555 [Paracoccus pantotrophus]|uniref:Uncharacterized protein n=1 Tax=Paracoccus pantotrophus TaxID=82367 RepID=A0A7H9BRE8_PARPN|nr:hypothetical protein [Paracoccus pantotrophus]QLH13556.1 hypothetical protein HYQ43_04555 [Paracoccus pantotrophus]
MSTFHRYDDPTNGTAAALAVLAAVAVLFFGIGAFAGYAWSASASRPADCFALTSHECSALMETR